MKRNTKYTEAPEEIKDALLSTKEIKDFLPPPEQLIRKVLDNYSEHYAK